MLIERMADTRSHPTPEQRTEQFAEAVAVRVDAVTAQRLGDYHKALSSLAVAREIFTHLDDSSQVAWTMYHEGQILDLIDRSDEALQRFTEAETMFRLIGDARGLRLMPRCRADVLRRRGRHDEALALYESALALSRDAGDFAGEIVTLSGRGELHLLRQAQHLASTDLSEALELLRRHPRPASETDFLVFARLARGAASPENARAHAAQARTIAQALGIAQDRSDPDLSANLHWLRTI